MKKMEPTWQSDCGRVQLYLGDCRDMEAMGKEVSVNGFKQRRMFA